MKKKKRGQRKIGLTPAFSVQLHSRQFKNISLIAKRQNMSRGQVIRRLLDEALLDSSLAS